MSEERSPENDVRLSEALLWACALALPIGVVDAAFALSRVPRGAPVVVGGLAVLLLHPALASLLVAATWPVLRLASARVRRTATLWLSAPPGGLEATRTLVLFARGALVLVAVHAAAAAGVRLLGQIQTALYVALGQTLLAVGAFALAWTTGDLLARKLADVALPLPGLSRARAFTSSVLLAGVLYGVLWLQRDLLFKEIDPWLVLGLLLHVVVPLLAVTLPGLRGAGQRASLGALALVVLALVVGSAPGASALLGIYAPVASELTRAAAPLSDFDDDGRAWLLGGADCGPFDAEVYAGAAEKIGDGVDQDCDGDDLDLGDVDATALEPLPEAELSELIVVISVDSLRQDHLGVYGGGELTPHIDRWAKHAVVFENAYSSGAVTLAAIPGLLTGRAMTEVYRHMVARRLDNKLPTLPEVLKPAGFVSGMIVDGIAARGHGWDRGFDSRVDLLNAERERADEIVDLALTWLDEHDEGKRLLWVHVFDPHAPYRDIKELKLGADRKGRYAEGVSWTDRHVGRLLERLEKERATVVLVADHGEHLGERGLVAHGKDVYGPVARIPLLIRTPWSAPRRVRTAVWQLDVLPTLAHLAGTGAPATRGKSLVPELKGAPADLSRAVFTEAYYGYDWISVSTATHRLLYAAHANNYELYDVRSDVGESENLYLAGDETSDVMRRHLALFSATVRDPDGRSQEVHEQRNTVDEVPKEARLSSPAKLGDDVEVLGYRLRVDKKKHAFEVYLRPIRPLTRSFKVEVVLEKNGEKQRLATFPGRGRYPTHLWVAGSIVPVSFSSEVLSDLEGWNVTVAFVDATGTGERVVARPDPLPPPGGTRTGP